MTRAFDLLFWPFRAVHPLYALAAASLLTGIIMAAVFRFTSDPRAIRRAKDQLQAGLLAVRIYQDQLGIVLRSYARIGRGSLDYLRRSFVPLAVMLLPLAVILAQLDVRLGYASPRAGDKFLVKVRTARQIPLDQVALEVPDGLALDVPPVRIAEEREIAWRIRAEREGRFTLRVLASGQAFEKQMVVSRDLAALPAARVEGALRQTLFYPGESALGSGAPVESIEIGYRRRQIEVAGYEISWPLPFFVLSLAAAFAMKPVLKAEF